MGLVEYLGEWRRERDSGRRELEQGDALGDLCDERLIDHLCDEKPWVNLRVTH